MTCPSPPTGRPRALTLPLFPAMTREDVEDVARALEDVLA